MWTAAMEGIKMQDNLIEIERETNIEKMKRIRMALFDELTNKLVVIDIQKNALLRNYNEAVKQIDIDIKNMEADKNGRQRKKEK
jgi:hypothetical protein